jgi:hypothetical protein
VISIAFSSGKIALIQLCPFEQLVATMIPECRKSVLGRTAKIHSRLNLQTFLPNFAVIEEGALTTTVVG